MTINKQYNSWPELYDELSRIYSCKFGDNTQEKKLAMDFLMQVCRDEHITAQHLVAKMYELKAASNDFQSKLSNQIMNRYWEKSFVEGTPLRKFRYEDDE